MFNMKKTTAFFLCIGVIAMIGGGIGAGVFYQRAEKSMTTHKVEEYKIKKKTSSEEIHLILNGNSNYVIQTENLDKVMMETSFGSSASIESSMKVEEKENQLIISTTGNQSALEISNFRIGFFLDDFNPEVTLTIPENARKIIVEGNGQGNIRFDTIKSEDLSINLSSSDLSFNTINTDKLNVTLFSGDIHLYGDTRSKEVIVSTTSGDLELIDLSAEKVTASTKAGDIYLDQINGTSTIETTLGDINATNLKGDASVKIGTGSFELNGDSLPKKLKVVTTLGDISIYPQEILYNTSIKANSTLGDITIYGEERKTYLDGYPNRTFDLTTGTGDITVDGPSEYEEE